MYTMIRIGLLGCGNIGHLIAKYREGVEIVALYDILYEKALDLASSCNGRPYQDFDEFLNADMDLVVEAASVRAVMRYAEQVLASGKDLVVMSVGAFSDQEFYTLIRETAIEHHRKVRIPSGAVMGLDNAKIGQIGGIDRVLLRTTKNPKSLGLEVTERTEIFHGRAEDCIRAFPKNLNVSVALTLASGREVDVELFADPAVDRNIHEITMEGKFGDAYIRVRNVPSPDNPATSYLAALSILTLLKNLDEPIVVGT